jgi:hypothetical protein
LEEANCVWLVSNIRRAVNDKTVKDMMPPAFKQALVERGVLGSLVFIATQTDIIVRSEVAENLNLAPDVSVLECAHRRNDYFRSKLAADFKRGINRSLLNLYQVSFPLIMSLLQKKKIDLKRGINSDLAHTQQQRVLCANLYASVLAKCKEKHAHRREQAQILKSSRSLSRACSLSLSLPPSLPLSLDYTYYILHIMLYRYTHTGAGAHSHKYSL